MDMDTFDLDDLDDLDNIEYDWDNLATDVDGGGQGGSVPAPNSGMHQQQHHQMQQSPGVSNNKQRNEHYQSMHTPGDNGQYSKNVGHTDPTPGTDNSNTQVRLDREREGRCADCGAQTHDVQFDPSVPGRSIKVPLSVPGEVHRGRCLFCHPLPMYRQSSSGSSAQPAAVPRQHKKAPEIIDLDDNVHSNSGLLDRHIARSRPQVASPYDRQISSSASVCTQGSHQSSHSIYSHQSAPVWGGQQQQQQQQQQVQFPPQQQTNHGFANDFVEQYQHQILQHQQLQQQQYADDSGSVYSQASHASHHSHHSQAANSHVSHNTHATYNSFVQHGQQQQQHHQLMSPQTDRDGRFSYLATNSNVSNNSNPITPAPGDFNSAIETTLRQMQDDSLNFESVIQSMRNFPNHALVQEKGCAILWVQTYNAEICLALSNIGGVNTVLDAMKNHPQVARLQRAACEALRNLCVLSINRQLLIGAGGVPLIVEAMQRHTDEPQVQRSGCTALASVAEGGMEYKIGVAECGGILAVMKAVESHPENDLVLRAAYQALRMLGYNPGATNGDRGP
jgi:hypothetical protein